MHERFLGTVLPMPIHPLRCLPDPPTPALLAGATYDLRREAAYNLALIYKASGAGALAKQVLRQHLTV